MSGIRGLAEHGFAKEKLPQTYSIQASRQFSVDPGFNAVRMACSVPRNIGCLNFRRNPGAVLCCSWHGTGRDDLGECCIHFDLNSSGGVLFRPVELAQLLLQGM